MSSTTALTLRRRGGFDGSFWATLFAITSAKPDDVGREPSLVRGGAVGDGAQLVRLDAEGLTGRHLGGAAERALEEDASRRQVALERLQRDLAQHALDHVGRDRFLRCTAQFGRAASLGSAWPAGVARTEAAIRFARRRSWGSGIHAGSSLAGADLEWVRGSARLPRL